MISLACLLPFPSVNVGGFDEDFVMLWGPSYRHIVDLSDVEKSIFIIPMGQSGHLLEEGYENLLPLWKNTEYIPMKTTGYEVSVCICQKGCVCTCACVQMCVCVCVFVSACVRVGIRDVCVCVCGWMGGSVYTFFCLICEFLFTLCLPF